LIQKTSKDPVGFLEVLQLEKQEPAAKMLLPQHESHADDPCKEKRVTASHNQ
jgi:hypothetical protein